MMIFDLYTSRGTAILYIIIGIYCMDSRLQRLQLRRVLYLYIELYRAIIVIINELGC